MEKANKMLDKAKAVEQPRKEGEEVKKKKAEKVVKE